MNNSTTTNLYFYFTPGKTTQELACDSNSQSMLKVSKTENELQKVLKHRLDDDNTVTSEEAMTQRLHAISESSGAERKESLRNSLRQETGCQKTLFADEDDEERYGIEVERDHQYKQEDREKTLGFERAICDESVVDFEEKLALPTHLLTTQKLIKTISKQKKTAAMITTTSVTSLGKHCSAKRSSPQLSASSMKLITQIQSSAHSTAVVQRSLSPSRNSHVNAILNKPSLKDRYKSLLGSKIVNVTDKTNEESVKLFQKIEEVMFKHVHILLSELVQVIPQLTVQKMNALMNISPQIYALSLHRHNNGATDMQIVLPLSENAFDVNQLKEKRLADFKQILYFAEKAKDAAAAAASNESTDKLTEAIKESLESKKSQLFDAFRSLLSQDEASQQQSAIVTASVQLRDVAEALQEYFLTRNVSNVFKLNLVEQISKRMSVDLPTAEQKLQQLLLAHPTWLTELRSSLLGSIVRVNYAFDLSLIV